MIDDPEYVEKMKYKLDIYKKLKITLICMYEETDSEKITNVLDRKLQFYKRDQINYLNKY